MPFFTLIAAAVLLISGVPGEDQDSDIVYSLSYRYLTDTLDFSDERREHSVYRGSALFSPDTVFNYTKVTIKDGSNGRDESRYTWNLVFDDASEKHRFIAGNFFAGFGAGMIIGKKSYMSSDVHTSGISASRSRPLSPCSSGNPVFAFRGAGGSYSVKHGHNSSRAVLFYSVRNRFAEWESSDDTRSGYSYNSISGRYESSPANSEPLEIHDGAFMYEYILGDILRFQVYGLSSFIKQPGGGYFLLNYDNSTNEGRGEKGYGAYGVFAEYQDDYLDLFYEGGYTRRDYEDDEGAETSRGGFGSVFGLRFRHPDLRFFFTGKTADEKFHARYGSGRVDPEKAMILSLRARLDRGLWAGGEYFVEKRVLPPYRGNALPSRISRSGFLEYRLNSKNLFEARAAKTESDSGIKTSIYERYSGKYLYNGKYSRFSFRSSIQYRNESDRSYMYALTGRAGPWRGFTAGAEFWDITAAKGNPVYSSAGMWGCISGGGFVYESSRTVAASLVFRKNELEIFGGYLWRFGSGELIENRMQFSCGYTF